MTNIDMTNSYAGQQPYGIYGQSRHEAEQLPNIRKNIPLLRLDNST
jgi:hypothetical protein